MRRRSIGAYFDALAEGDPVAIGITIFFVVVAALAGAFTLKVRRDFRREDEAKRKRWGVKDPKKK